MLIQNCRGTFGSGGELDPFRQEYDDGIATLTWLKSQPWFNGDLATYGASYPGFTVWAVAAGGGFAPSLPSPSEPGHYRSDPSNPTPSVAGAGRFLRGRALQDNRALEAREDVLTYTSKPLDRDVEIIDHASAFRDR